jgi:formamidopyrimidine-DNA glycosylase
LLDQRVLAGVGNIYAAEALWEARIDPRALAASLGLRELTRLLVAVRAVLERASGSRYYGEDRESSRFRVYDREGAPCPRCASPVARMTQSGRSTYYCPRCQR